MTDNKINPGKASTNNVCMSEYRLSNGVRIHEIKLPFELEITNLNFRYFSDYIFRFYYFSPVIFLHQM
jgi:hypothetical protein